MLPGLLLTAALAADPLGSALAHYEALASYRATMRASRGDGAVEVIRYHYRKPGFVRMEFVHPHRGALLVYDPAARQVTLWPFGPGTFPRLRLSPTNPLIRSASGHTVDRSDAGALLHDARTLERSGTARTIGQEQVDGIAALHVVVEGSGSRTVDGVHRYDLWLDASTFFPRRAESRDARGELVESMTMEDLELDVEFPERFFAPG